MLAQCGEYKYIGRDGASLSYNSHSPTLTILFPTFSPRNQKFWIKETTDSKIKNTIIDLIVQPVTINELVDWANQVWLNGLGRPWIMGLACIKVPRPSLHHPYMWTVLTRKNLYVNNIDILPLATVQCTSKFLLISMLTQSNNECDPLGYEWNKKWACAKGTSIWLGDFIVSHFGPSALNNSYYLGVNLSKPGTRGPLNSVSQHVCITTTFITPIE